ncbi:MAG: VWA domain-containing protein [Bacteroidales bacterium]|nr:VWA domain-containing protein [Bacteroidales bacterium]
MKRLSLSRIFMLFACFFLFLPFYLNAQEYQIGYIPTTRILFIFDASNSMAGQWDGEVKIDIARRILIEMVDSLENMENVELALRVYGHQSPVPPQDCNDTKLEVPFGPGNATRIRQKLRFITPRGTTPIAHSLELAQGDFPPCDRCRNIIILITDGIEACDGDPCAVSLALQKKGIILRPFVIGIGTDMGFRETFNCIGEYYNTPNKKEFKEALKVIISQALNETSSQVNLLDSRKAPKESDVNIVFYDQLSGKIRYNMIHTLNHKGNPDTLSLDHMSTYRIVAQTIPPVLKDSVVLTAGRHNIIGMDAPQGYLHIKTSRGRAYDNEKILVRKSGEHKTLNVQQMGTSERYIVGNYDLEIPVYPIIHLEQVTIKQSYTTTVEIPEPGLIIFSSNQPGFGSLYQLTKEEDQLWVLNLREGINSQKVYLLPGSYRVIYRRGDLKSTSFTIVRDFEVKSGDSETIAFY